MGFNVAAETVKAKETCRCVALLPRPEPKQRWWDLIAWNGLFLCAFKISSVSSQLDVSCVFLISQIRPVRRVSSSQSLWEVKADACQISSPPDVSTCCIYYCVLPNTCLTVPTTHTHTSTSTSSLPIKLWNHLHIFFFDLNQYNVTVK